MRILFLTNLYPTPHQPQRAAYNRQHATAMATRGHDVRVIAPIAWTDERAARRRGQPALPASRRVDLDGLTVDHPRFFFPPKILRSQYGRCFRASVARCFGRVVDEFRPDVVLSSWAYPDGWAAVRMGHAAGVPVVVNVVGSDVLLAGGSRLSLVAEAVRSADGVLAASRQLAARAVELGAAPGRVRAVHNGVDTRAFRPGDKAAARARLGVGPADRLALFVGNLVPVKGPDVLIDACLRLAAREPTFACRLIGAGPMRESLERRIAAAGVGDAVKFVGPVPHADLPDWFRAADVAVLPSRSEGVPNVLLEAAACGTPVVASDVGGVAEVASLGRVRLVPPGDAAALAEGIAGTLAGDLPPSPTEAVRGHDEAAADIADVLREAVRRFADQFPRPSSFTPVPAAAGRPIDPC